MPISLIIRSALGVVAILLAAGGIWILTLPSPRRNSAVPPIPKSEVEVTLAALKPPKRQRPLIAIIGANAGTEVNDYVMTYGILRRAEVADVVALGTTSGPITLYPVLKVQSQATIAEFDTQHPDGADYVIVPAMSRDDDPAVLQWIKNQSAKHATIIGVCAGAKIVAAAGLLDGKRATTHWYYLKAMLKKHPSIRYVADRRFVVEPGIATTTGITAAMPMTLTLIEAIAGRDKAEAVARSLGVAEWNARHDSSAFKFTRPFALTAMGNKLAFWNRDEFTVELTSGIDEVSLAIVADAWSRTYRSHAVTFSRTAGAIETRNGLRLIPDRVLETSALKQEQLPDFRGQPPAEALDKTLDAIAARYGAGTANLVAMQLEYSRR
ncbi:MAG TPA: DJ-1/PfpI family protein [Opitutaceae bacterium]|nr:DJ-1/PfpI family protein [Opitutaceae bacterium]